MYGNRSNEILEVLRTNPAAVVPVVLRRLRQRHQQWVQIKNEWEKEIIS